MSRYSGCGLAYASGYDPEMFLEEEVDIDYDEDIYEDEEWDYDADEDEWYDEEEWPEEYD